MLNAMTLGTVLGLSAGLAPGPLLVFLVSQTLKYNTREGIKVAVAPLITDLPIIIVAIFLLTKLSAHQKALAMISFFGAAFVCYLAYQTIHFPPLEKALTHANPGSLKKATIINFLNPHPYLFWLAVGTPIMATAQEKSRFGALAFILAFYACLVGSKLFLALALGRSRALIRGRTYIYTLRALGILMFLLALLLFRDALRLLAT